MGVMEYAAKFSELSHFTPIQVDIEKIKMDHFEQELKGNIKYIAVGHAYANFQEMYQRVVMIAQVIDETEAENRELNQAKSNSSSTGSSSQGNRNFERFNLRRAQIKGKQPV